MSEMFDVSSGCLWCPVQRGGASIAGPVQSGQGRRMGPLYAIIVIILLLSNFRCSDILLHSLMKVSSLCLRIVPDAKSLPFGTICIFKFIL